MSFFDTVSRIIQQGKEMAVKATPSTKVSYTQQPIKPVTFGIPTAPQQQMPTATAQTTRQTVAPAQIQAPQMPVPKLSPMDVIKRGGTITAPKTNPVLAMSFDEARKQGKAGEFMRADRQQKSEKQIEYLREKLGGLAPFLVGTGVKEAPNKTGGFVGALENMGAMVRQKGIPGAFVEGFVSKINPTKEEVAEKIMNYSDILVNKGINPDKAQEYAVKNLANQSPNASALSGLNIPTEDLPNDVKNALRLTNFTEDVFAVLDAPVFMGSTKPIKMGIKSLIKPAKYTSEMEKAVREFADVANGVKKVTPEEKADILAHGQSLADALVKKGYIQEDVAMKGDKALADTLRKHMDESLALTQEKARPKNILDNTVLKQKPNLIDEPKIRTKVDVTARDLAGTKFTIPAGSKIIPKKDGKKFYIDVDGKQYAIPKNQYDNLKGQSDVSVATPFAPELKGTVETVKGMSKDKNAVRAELEKKGVFIEQDMSGEANLVNKNGDLIEYDDLSPEQRKKVDFVTGDADSYAGIDSGKYSQYTLDGGENYREILIQAPYNKRSSRLDELQKKEDINSLTSAEEKEYEKLVTEFRGKESDSTYKSSHWSEPNVISHIRMNERTVDGKKYAFMEELQSDWAREGRDKGFDQGMSLEEGRKLLPKGWRTVPGDTWKVVDEEGKTVVSKLDSADKAFGGSEAVAIGRAIGEPSLMGNYKPGVPNNPLLKDWQIPTTKRALIEAVDSGADRFAWINGEQTSARYNLATHVENVEWKKSTGDTPDKVGRIVGLLPKGRNEVIKMVIDENGSVVNQVGGSADWKGKKLDEVLGKGLADKIMEKETGTLSGDGLSFGGEWAKNLYDKQVRDIVKKLTGAEVKTVDMGLPVANKKPSRFIKNSGRDVGGSLSKNDLKVGLEINEESFGDLVITEVLENGKFRAIPKINYNSLKDQMSIDKMNSLLATNDFDLSSTRAAVQQYIELTPEVKARIQSEAPKFKLSPDDSKIPLIYRMLMDVAQKDSTIAKESKDFKKIFGTDNAVIKGVPFFDEVDKLGEMNKGVINLLEKNGKVSEAVAKHEMWHLYKIGMVTKAEQEIIIKMENELLFKFPKKAEALRKAGYKQLEIAEELMADEFSRYYRTGRTFSQKLAVIFDRLIQRIEMIFKNKTDVLAYFKNVSKKTTGKIERNAGVVKSKLEQNTSSETGNLANLKRIKKDAYEQLVQAKQAYKTAGLQNKRALQLEVMKKQDAYNLLNRSIESSQKTVTDFKSTQKLNPIDQLIASNKVRVVSREGRDVYQVKKGTQWANVRDEDSAIKQVTRPKVSKAISLPERIEQRLLGAQLAKEALENEPASNLGKFVTTRGEFRGQLKEATGKGTGFGRSGDDIADQYGFSSAEEARIAYDDYKVRKEQVNEEMREAKLEAQKARTEAKKPIKTDTMKVRQMSRSRNIPTWERNATEQIAKEERIVSRQKESPFRSVLDEPTPISKARVEQLEKSAMPTVDDIRPSAPYKVDSLKDIVTKTPLERKVGIFNYLNTPNRVLKKIGMNKEADLLRKQYDKYEMELSKNIDKISAWVNRVPKDASERIFQHLDGKAVRLSAEEQKVADEIRVYLKEWADRLGLPEENRVANYITRLFDDQLIKKEFDEDLAKIISGKIPGEVYNPFLQKRLGAKGYKQDVWGALDAYTKRATRKVHLDPVLERVQERVGSSAEFSNLEESQFDYIRDYISNVQMRPTKRDNQIDNAIKQAVGYRLGQRPVVTVSKTLRRMTYRGFLGGNIGSAVRNLSQGVNTYAVLGERYTAIGYAKLLNPASRKELLEQGIFNNNFIEDRVLSSTKKLLQKADKTLWFFFDQAEKINRGAAYLGAKAKGIGKGMGEEEAIDYAKSIVRKTQFSYDVIDQPVALGSDIMKTMFQFQTYTVKQLEFLSEMVVGSIKGDEKMQNALGMLRYAVAGYVFVNTVGKALGMEESELVPLWSNMTGERKNSLAPAFNFPKEIGKAILGTPDKYGNERDLKDKMSDIGKSLVGLIPAGSQIKKTYEGLKAIKEGGSYDSAGRLQFEQGESKASKVQSILFGKYASDKAKAYFDKGTGTGNKELDKVIKARKEADAKRPEEAIKILEELKTLQPEQANARLKEIKAQDEALFNKIKALKQAKDLNWSSEEKAIENLGVTDGTKAKFVYSKIQKLSTPEEKNAYIKDLLDRKIISKEVLKQIKELKEGGIIE